MNNNLHKNSKNELIDEILKLREIEKRLIEENEELQQEIKDLE